ncbi:2'-5' RNA ligase family protein [Celerinatantimonas diazotrophica]|uniref:RNA 2',3'-cyclic phosphodiesterase n=1 Tax=Celerinatantimonas diazotrophica TaxID=412034 RepID=A0A4R1J947_9GAMM|nr:2'-5' RNA ligase family protein [Celerinatantimonas diazotrophica]TCK46914.1 2'-5' RNA ligase [Celerinatantimonas diazotrophica]CAG9295682.1 RNA 2',3'-cyclic phosphodiesterase [Celerinatantimonas diazotrophica]
MAQSRYFFAITVNPSHHQQLLTLQQKWLTYLVTEDLAHHHVRLIPPENFHLTLHFLGPQTTYELQQAKELAREINVNTFIVQSDGLGYFAKAKTGYLSIQCCKSLYLLAQQLGNCEPYIPHVSLIRKLTQAALPNVKLPLLSWQVNGFDLYCSVGNGALYQRIEHFSLGN